MRWNRPSGRNISTTAITMYTEKSSATGAKCTAMERARPTMSAPTAAPSMLPRPPMMTTANDKIITPTDTPGCTEIMGAVKAPPMAARNTPMENASM